MSYLVIEVQVVSNNYRDSRRFSREERFRGAIFSLGDKYIKKVRKKVADYIKTNENQKGETSLQ